MKMLTKKDLCAASGDNGCPGYRAGDCDRAECRINHIKWDTGGEQILASATCGVTAECKPVPATRIVHHIADRDGSGQWVACALSWRDAGVIAACNARGEHHQISQDGKRSDGDRMFEIKASSRITAADMDGLGLSFALGVKGIEDGKCQMVYRNVCGDWEIPFDTEITVIRISPNGQYIAIGDKAGYVSIVNMTTRKVEQRPTRIGGNDEGNHPISSISWKPNSTHIAYCSPCSPQISRWSVASNGALAPATIERPDAVEYYDVRDIIIVRSNGAEKAHMRCGLMEAGTWKFSPENDDVADGPSADGNIGESIISKMPNQDLIASFSRIESSVKFWKLF